VISLNQANIAVSRLAALAYYPQEVIARSEIAAMLVRMVSTPEQLEWLVRQFIDHVGEWKGPRELRAVFCTKFKPADRIEEWSGLSGYTASDSESAHAFTSEEFKTLDGSFDPASALGRNAAIKKLQ
jgi:hypothetical protein